MPLTCNIDRKGRRLRAVNGFILLALAIFLAIFWANGNGLIPWLIVVFCLLMGLFCIFEGLVGWCALRAMGIKTPH